MQDYSTWLGFGRTDKLIHQLLLQTLYCYPEMSKDKLILKRVCLVQRQNRHYRLKCNNEITPTI